MKQIIRLNESDLHHMIKEAVKAILNEDLNEFADAIKELKKVLNMQDNG